MKLRFTIHDLRAKAALCLALLTGAVLRAPAQATGGGVIVSGGGGGSSSTISASNGVVLMTGGNGAFQDMSNGVAGYKGNIGISFGGNNIGYLWNANGAGTGSAFWGGSLSIPGGVGDVGDQTHDVANSAYNQPTGAGVTTGGNMNINFRGGPNGSRETNVWNGSTTVDTYFFVNNMNPFDSGASFGLRSADTNLAAIGASPLLTNVDGVVIGIPQFGFDMIDIPFSYPVGLNNQAGSDVLIWSKPFFGLSLNISFSSNGTAYPGQYSTMLVDNRYESNAATPLMVDFPVLNGEGGTYLPTQPLWQNAFAVDEINNIVYASTNTTNGIFNANLVNANKFSVGQFSPHGYNPSATNLFSINSTSGGHFTTAGVFPCLWTFDYAGDVSQRLGIGVTTAYPNLVYAQGAELDIQQASISDLSTGLGAATFTNEFHLKNGTLALTGSISTKGTATGIITATGYTNILGTNVYVNCIGTAVAVTIKNNAGTAVATNTVVTGGTIIPLQPGGSISAASGLAGTYWVQ